MLSWTGGSFDDPFVTDTTKRRVSLWSQQAPPTHYTELDMTGRPIQTSLKLMWPQEPPASPMAILPKDHKFQPDKPALGLTVPSSADASAVRALILSSKAGARPRVKMDTEHGKGLQEEDDDAAPSQSVDDQKGKLVGDRLPRPIWTSGKDHFEGGGTVWPSSEWCTRQPDPEGQQRVLTGIGG
ncbi:hypothetical protein scyTo_0024907, partial [Scyliorhinus torazame]|nr:hypothetical protein [Scyliorhinus torazame]